MEDMKLRLRRFDYTFWGLVMLVGLFFAGRGFLELPGTFAESGEEARVSRMSRMMEGEARFVTVFDGGRKLQFKTTATTVGEVLDRAKIVTHEADIVEPDRRAVVDEDNFYVNIYRARPVMVRDGVVQRIVETASFDVESIAEAAGVALYDGDSVEKMSSPAVATENVVATYEVRRQGGRMATEEVRLPAPEEKREDAELAAGKTRVMQAGEEGRKVVKYRVNFKDGREHSRQKVAEEVVVVPKARIVAVGTKAGVEHREPQKVALSGECVDWVRAAGVAEADVAAALDLIYRESKCNPLSRNRYSGAYGIPQSLPGNKMASMGADWETNPVTQIRWMDRYVKGRYGGWQQALNFWHCIGVCNGVNKRSFWY